jgi:hypothetical protein
MRKLRSVFGSRQAVWTNAAREVSRVAETQVAGHRRLPSLGLDSRGSGGASLQPMNRSILRRILVALVIALIMFLGPQVVFRHRLNPFAVSNAINYHGRGFRGGREITALDAAALVRIGRGVWPERAVLAHSKSTGMGSAHTVIVLENWDHRYYLYSLQGGP